MRDVGIRACKCVLERSLLLPMLYLIIINIEGSVPRKYLCFHVNFHVGLSLSGAASVSLQDSTYVTRRLTDALTEY